MKITRTDGKRSACNFCLGKFRMGSGPVIEFSREGGGGGLAATICDDCLEELYIKAKSLQTKGENQ